MVSQHFLFFFWFGLFDPCDATRVVRIESAKWPVMIAIRYDASVRVNFLVLDLGLDLGCLGRRKTGFSFSQRERERLETSIRITTT